MGGVGRVDLLRGQIHWAWLDPVVGSEQAGRRPVVIVACNDLLVGPTALCVPVTSRIPERVPTYAVLLPAERTGLPRDGIALCHQVRALSVARLVRRAGDVSPQDMRSIDATLLYVLGLEDAA